MLGIYQNQQNSHIQQQQHLIEHRESLIEQQEPLLQYQEQIIEQQATIQITNHHESNNTLIYLNEQSDDDDIDDDNENLNADSLNELLRGEITKEELAAAYLASFYSGKTAQSSLQIIYNCKISVQKLVMVDVPNFYSLVKHIQKMLMVILKLLLNV